MHWNHRFKPVKRILKKMGITLLFLWVLYGLIANVALNLPLLKQNWQRPTRKVQFTWEAGRSWAPGQLTLFGVSLKKSQLQREWHYQTPKLTAQFSLTSLLNRTFNLESLVLEELLIRESIPESPLPQTPVPQTPVPQTPVPQTPVPQTPVPQTPVPQTLLPQAASLPSETPSSDEARPRAWLWNLEDIRLEGPLTLQARRYALTTQIQGSLALTFRPREETRIFPSALVLENIDLSLEEVPLISQGRAELNLEAPPFVPSQHRGSQILCPYQFSLTMEGHSAMKSLPLAATLPPKVVHMTEAGYLSLQCFWDQGQVLSGSAIQLSDFHTQIQFKALQFSGQGSLRGALHHVWSFFPELPPLGFNLSLVHPILVFTSAEESTLAEGGRLNVTLTQETPDGEPLMSATLTDLTATHLPQMVSLWGDHFPFTPLKGRATLSGRLNFAPVSGNLGADLMLQCQDLQFDPMDHHPREAEIALSFYHLGSEPQSLDFSGTRLSFSHPQQGTRATLQLSDAKMTWKGKRPNLSTVAAQCVLEGSVNHLDLFTPLFQGKPHLALDGAATVKGRLFYEKGELTPPSRFQFLAKPLIVDFLEYQIRGLGEVEWSLRNTEMGHQLKGSIGLRDYKVTRSGYQSLSGGGQELQTQVAIQPFSLHTKNDSWSLSVHLKKHLLDDLTSLNELWSNQDAFQIIKGSGQIDGVLRVDGPTGALKGGLSLKALDLSMTLNDYWFQGDAQAQLALNSANLTDFIFDLSGSTVSLDRLRSEDVPPGQTWGVHCALKDSVLRWKDPLAWRGAMNFTMTDSRPLVGLYSQHHRALRYLKSLLDINNLAGEASFQITDQVVHVPFYQANGDRLSLQGKMHLAEGERHGALWVSFRDVPFTLTKHNEDHGLILFRPWDRFQSFLLPDPQPLPFLGPQRQDSR